MWCFGESVVWMPHKGNIPSSYSNKTKQEKLHFKTKLYGGGWWSSKQITSGF